VKYTCAHLPRFRPRVGFWSGFSSELEICSISSDALLVEFVTFSP
jgi:hypothetical protein